MPKWAYAWTLGCTIGFEFMDDDFLGGGWVLSLFIIKILHFKNLPPDMSDGYPDE